MSFDIAPVGRTPGTAPAATDKSHNTAPSNAAQDSVTVDTIPSSPPPEVHEAMGVAAQAYDKLQAQGREMRFKVNQGTGKLVVEVHDLHGQLLFQVPASKALDVAGGASLD
ncbi:MAG TPA: hypothetical protein VH279_10565 [Solirubrobacteraceae bacterium]|jgi:hypothetical protein|nr:hypothetical protein [Solirubrobacteraceae bacterium]